jgi:hypothetical protein
VAYINPTSSIEDFYDNLYYCVARCEAHPVALKYAAPVQAAIDGLGKVVGDRNIKANAQQKLMAKRDFARDAMCDAYEPFSLQVAAHYGSKTAPETLRLVPWAPSTLAGMSFKMLPAVMAAWKSQLDLPLTPAEVKKFAKPVLDQWDVFQKAQGAVEASTFGLKNAIAAVDAHKLTALETLAKTRSGLGSDFPRKPKVVARFFIKQKKKGAKDEAAAESVEPA